MNSKYLLFIGKFFKCNLKHYNLNNVSFIDFRKYVLSPETSKEYYYIMLLDDKKHYLGSETFNLNEISDKLLKMFNLNETETLKTYLGSVTLLKEKKFFVIDD